MQKSNLGFYFHIPFCPHICPYCDFTKTSKFKKKDISAYFEALLNQLNYFLKLLNVTKTEKKDFVTVYFGGGTPGLFSSQYYLPLLNKLKEYYELEEITLETNPYTNYEKNFIDYFNAGIHRLTLGAQSLCPNTLKILGRKHTTQDVLNNISWAKDAGIYNIQVDLIYGLKKNTRQIPVEEEIQILSDHGATGISAYFLTLEKNTEFANSNLIDEEFGADEYDAIVEKCAQRNFKQLETSNFSKYPSMHNQLYWTGKPYIGIGTGAHGLLPSTPNAPYGLRYKIGNSILNRVQGDDNLIFSNSNDCQYHFEINYEPPRTKKDYIEENIFTRLRTLDGLDISWLAQTCEFENVVEIILNNAKLKRALDEGKLIYNQNKFYLNAKEKIRGDAWALDFISLFS